LTDVLQQQLEAEFDGPRDYGDPLDPEEASEEDIAAELSRRGRRPAHPDTEAPPFELAGDQTEEGVEGGASEEEPFQEDALEDEAAETRLALMSPGSAAASSPPDEDAALEWTRSTGEELGVAEEPEADGGVPAAPEDDSPGEPGTRARQRGTREPSGRPVEHGLKERLGPLWEHLIADTNFPLEALERRPGERRRWERYLYATGKTRDGSRAALVASPSVDSHLLVYGLRFLTDQRDAKEDIRHLVLCAPYFTDEFRKAAYLVDPKKVRLRLLKLPAVGDLDGGYRSVDTLRPESRDVGRDFEELLSEVTSLKLRRLLARFKEVAEGAVVESGGEGAFCRGRKIFFRMRGEDLLVARPRDNTVLLEILYPRTRTLRLAENNFQQTLAKVKESFEAARKSAGLAQREAAFRLAVRRVLEEGAGDLVPLETDVSVGGNRLRIDLLAVRTNGAPVALQVRTRLTLEEFQRSLIAFSALREQTILLKRALGQAGGRLNPNREAELGFVALRIPDAAAAIADLLVPRVSFLRVRPERRWWEASLKLEGLEPARMGEAEVEPASQKQLPRHGQARMRAERPVFRIEGKNPAVIVSHYDRDGIIASLVLARAVPNVVAQRFMSSEDFITLFYTPEIQEGLPEVYDLYVTDLRIRASGRLAPEVKDAFLDRIRKHKGNIYWLDHVYWQDVDRREMEASIGRANLVITPRERTAALVVKRALKIQDEFSDKLIDLLHGELDESEYNAWGKGWLSIIDYLRVDLERIEPALRALREGRPEAMDRDLLEEGMRREAEAESYVASRDFRVVIFGSYKLVIVDLPDKKSLNYTSVTQKVRDRYRAQLSITAFGDTDTIIIANSFADRKGMNMNVLKEHLTKRFEWLRPVQGHENVITLKVEELPSRRERLDVIVNEIVRNRSAFA
jgi:hypothetical protein